MPVEEIYRQRDKIVKISTGVHNEKQLAEFMSKEQAIRDPTDNVQWRCWLFPDYTETESVMIYKVHHCIGDGISLVMMFANLCDTPDIQTFPQITMRFPLWQRVLINLLVPFMIAFIAIRQFCWWSRETNAIKNPKVEDQMTAYKAMALSKDVPIEMVKLKCKTLGATINEFVFGIISQTMKQYLVSQGDTTTRWIRIALPFSLRPPPAYPMGFEFKNDFAVLPVDMRLVDDLKTGIKVIQKDLAPLKASPMPFGWYYASYFILSLPFILA
jgi:hypothetical protein